MYSMDCETVKQANKENWDDVYYKVKKTSSGKAYGSFEVYTKTSVSNNYYINYHFVYT